MISLYVILVILFQKLYEFISTLECCSALYVFSIHFVFKIIYSWNPIYFLYAWKLIFILGFLDSPSTAVVLCFLFQFVFNSWFQFIFCMQEEFYRKLIFIIGFLDSVFSAVTLCFLFQLTLYWHINDFLNLFCVCTFFNEICNIHSWIFRFCMLLRVWPSIPAAKLLVKTWKSLLMPGSHRSMTCLS